MTSLAEETSLFTTASGVDLGVNPHRIDLHEGDFEIVRVYDVTGTIATTLTATATAGRSILLPDASGTVALTSALGSYVDLTTNQNVGGIKTFTSPPVFTGLASRNSSQAVVLGMQNFTFNLVTMNDILGRNTIDTITGKTINSGTNTIQLSTVGGANINTIIDQTLTTASSPQFAGLFLPTVGGTPASFNHAEDGTFVVNFTGAAIGSATFAFTRYGKDVTISWPDVNTAFVASNKINIVGQLPARLAPRQLEFGPIFVADNGATQTAVGRISFNPGTLDMLISLTAAGSNFAGPGAIGFLAGSYHYRTA